MHIVALRNGLSWVLLVLLCVSWMNAKKSEEMEETGEMESGEGVEDGELGENETMIEPQKLEFHSLLEHNCSYMNVNSNESEHCVLIQLTPNYNVEVMLPVYSKTLNQTLYVPFLVRSANKDTTFSRKTLSTFQVDGHRDNLTIIEDEYPAIPGEENILGVTFLDSSLLAIDFYAYEAGMLVYSKRKPGDFTLNWPLDAFKDKQLEQKAATISDKHRALKKEVKKLQHRSAAKLSDLRKMNKKKELTIVRLQQQLTEAKSNFTQGAATNGTVPVAVTNTTEEVHGTPGKTGTTAPDTESEAIPDTEDDEPESIEDLEPEDEEEDEELVKPKKKRPAKSKKPKKMKVDL